MLATVSRLTRQVAQRRQTMVNSIRNYAHHGPPAPGENLPIDINNRYKLTLYAAIYFSSGFGLPYLIVRHQLLKNKN